MEKKFNDLSDSQNQSRAMFIGTVLFDKLNKISSSISIHKEDFKEKYNDLMLKILGVDESFFEEDNNQDDFVNNSMISSQSDDIQDELSTTTPKLTAVETASVAWWGINSEPKEPWFKNIFNKLLDRTNDADIIDIHTRSHR